MIYKFLNRDRANTDADFCEVTHEANVAYIVLGKDKEESVEEFLQITLNSEDIEDLIEVLNKIKKNIEDFNS
ncbi:hypothetical protein [Chryseobacterium sediminis]|uniref:hypothetical protein n=1 Tax=Chryseobacterium sediminis TaxID=1679494 RepID=UPI002860D8D6|nr:hypothetical protein [Chryseobacterium sediminis]MDR6465161.1 hypothetical protein [Chryseobacterium sediminis]